MYSATTIAKYIVSKCARENEPISNLQLQKILYYIQREYVRCTGKGLFTDKIEAWQFGPVVRDVYYTYAIFGGSSITFSDNSDNKVSEIDTNAANIIDPIIEEKRVMDPWALVDDTHKKGGAWDQIYRGGAGNHKEIPLHLIRSAG